MEDNIQQQNKRTILVIEDNEINCEILMEILGDRYSLLFANNGQEGMAEMREHYSDISVVLLDIQMPVMNGYEVLEAKSKESVLKNLPVIVTTSSNGGDEEVRCLELGAQDFIRKPYDPIVVQLRIKSIINLRESNEANHKKAMFIQQVNHEIRTPMNAIIGFTQLLKDMAGNISGEEMTMMCDSISDNSYALLGMIDNMVALSNFESGNFTINIADVFPNKLCREIIKDTSFCAPEGVKVYFTTDVEDNFQFHSDQKCLKLSLYNYIINANKFTQQGEIHVHFSNTEKPGYLVFSVTNTGAPIPSDKTDYIFEPFTKINQFVPGMGIGLTIAQHVATALDGTAYLDTTYTEGTRFIFELKNNK